MNETKTCTKCGVCKPVVEFYANRRKKDGRDCYCIFCRKSIAADWRNANRQTIAEKNKSYYFENLEREMARARKYREENPDKSRASVRRWKENNPEMVYLQQKRAYEKASTSLSDWYVKLVISTKSNIHRAVIPRPLIEAKRLQLKLERLINQRKSK